jgi:hypothetical protein
VEKVCFTTHSPATLEALLIWFSEILSVSNLGTAKFHGLLACAFLFDGYFPYGSSRSFLGST